MSYYEVLNVQQNAKEEDIRKAYRQKALEYHPDRTTYEISEAREKFRELDEAYKILSNEDRRALYDVYHSHKELFEKNILLGAYMQNQLKQMYMEYEQQQQKNSFLDDSILDEAPMIDLDLLIKIYNTRHHKSHYYNYYKELSHNIMQDIENEVQKEFQQKQGENSSVKNNQQQNNVYMDNSQHKTQRLDQMYSNEGTNKAKQKTKLKQSEIVIEANDSTSEQSIHRNKFYYNEESSGELSSTRNQSNNTNYQKNNHQTSNMKRQTTQNLDQKTQYEMYNNQYENKTHQQIEDELMNEDDDDDDQSDFQSNEFQYPQDLNDDIYEETQEDTHDRYDKEYLDENQCQQQIDYPIECITQDESIYGNQKYPLLQDFEQNYICKINKYTKNNQNSLNNIQNNRDFINNQQNNLNDPVSLQKNKVYSAQNNSQIQPINQHNENILRNQEQKQDHLNQYQKHQQQHEQKQQENQEKQQLTKKQIKTQWQTSLSKKILKRIKNKLPVFKLIKKVETVRQPIQWQKLQDKISQTQQQIQQNSQLIMKYRNKNKQLSIMEISKEKYIELCQRKRRLTEQQNKMKKKEDELEDFDAILDEKEIQYKQRCQKQINKNKNNLKINNSQNHPQLMSPSRIISIIDQPTAEKTTQQGNNRKPFNYNENDNMNLQDENLQMKISQFNNSKDDNNINQLLEKDGDDYSKNQEENSIFNSLETQYGDTETQNQDLQDYFEENNLDINNTTKYFVNQQENEQTLQQFSQQQDQYQSQNEQQSYTPYKDCQNINNTIDQQIYNPQYINQYDIQNQQQHNKMINNQNIIQQDIINNIEQYYNSQEHPKFLQPNFIQTPKNQTKTTPQQNRNNDIYQNQIQPYNNQLQCQNNPQQNQQIYQNFQNEENNQCIQSYQNLDNQNQLDDLFYQNNYNYEQNQ